MICKICNKQYQYKYGSFSKHLKNNHNISQQEYYNKYIIKNYNEMKCNFCSKESYFISIKLGYKSSCNSTKCINLKTKQTCLERYGDENYNNREKSEETCISLYNCNCVSKVDKFKEKNKVTRLERYGDENYNNRNKMKKTKLKNHGNENYNNRPQAKETCLEKYGDENYRNIIKSQNTCQERYGCDNVFQVKEIKNKMKKTNLEKYGVEYSLQLSEFREKGKLTRLEKYNDKNYNNRDKNQKTCQERYSVDNISQLNEIKQKKVNTCNKNYNCDNPSQSSIIQQKKIDTCMELYNVSHPMHIEEIFNKAQKSGKKWKVYTSPNNNIIKYQGYEHLYLNEYFKNLNNLEQDLISQPKKKDIGIIYYFKSDGSKHKYYPDFYHIPTNTIIEVKSTYTYTRDLEINLLKQQACIDLGFNFEFRIYNSKGSLVDPNTL